MDFWSLIAEHSTRPLDVEVTRARLEATLAKLPEPEEPAPVPKPWWKLG